MRTKKTQDSRLKTNSTPAEGDAMQREQQADEAFNAAELLAKLTEQQQRVLRHYVNDPNEGRVARQLGIQKQSVYNHLGRIQRRLHVGSRAELMKVAVPALDGLATPKNSWVKITQVKSPEND